MINDKGEEVGIIYGWYCIPTSLWYIGQTIKEEKRFKTHIKDAFNKRDNNIFHRALRKYGLENFVYCILEENVLRANLNMREMDWIEYYDSFYSGYNLTLGGGGIKGKSSGMKGKPAWNKGKIDIYSEETKKKMSESHKGIKNYNYNKPRTEETRKKISNANKSRVVTKETRKKNSESHKKKVNKYNLNGSYLQTYNSIIEAKTQNPKCDAISAVCKGKRRQAGGFIWKYAS